MLGKQKRFQRFLAMLLCLINVATTINNDRFSEPIKKSTRIQATKNEMFNLMNRRCQGDHTHCPLEGSMPGGGHRCREAENYGVSFAKYLAKAVMYE